MWIHEIAPERLAELFHNYQKAMMPEISGKGSEAGSTWEEMPLPDTNRLVAVARLTLLELGSTETKENSSRQYFAQPGEAEWGC